MFHSEQTHLQTFYGEDFVYQFVSTDPEGSAVLFTLLSGPKDATLSPAGLLIWKALSSSAVTFKLAIIDDCNAKTQAIVKVRNYLLCCLGLGLGNPCSHSTYVRFPGEQQNNTLFYILYTTY